MLRAARRLVAGTESTSGDSADECADYSSSYTAEYGERTTLATKRGSDEKTRGAYCLVILVSLPCVVVDELSDVGLRRDRGYLPRTRDRAVVPHDT
jgi:hypothetical protein